MQREQVAPNVDTYTSAQSQQEGKEQRPVKPKPLLFFFCFFFKLLRSARLQLTDELIGDLHHRSTDSTSEDLQRINELLSLPKNKESPQPSSSQ